MALGEAADRAAALAPIHPALLQRFSFLNAPGPAYSVGPCHPTRTSFSARHRKNCSITSLRQLVHVSPQSFDLILQRREFLLHRRQHGRNVSLVSARISLALMAEHRDDLQREALAEPPRGVRSLNSALQARQRHQTSFSPLPPVPAG